MSGRRAPPRGSAPHLAMLNTTVDVWVVAGVISLLGLGCRSEPPREGSPPPLATTPISRAGAAPAGSASGARPLVPPPAPPRGPARDTVPIAASTLKVSRMSFPGTPLPEQSVHVPAFEMDRYEVPVSEYRACVEAGQCGAPQAHTARCNYGASSRERHPVNCVSHPEAASFCAWISARLPSEDEWDAAILWAESREARVGDEGCLEKLETCSIDEPGSRVLPGWSDNVAEWTTSPFCQASHPLCAEIVVKGRGFHDTASYGTHERRLPPLTGSASEARRRPEEVGFRCVR